MSRVADYEDRYGESIEYLRESYPSEFKRIRRHSRTEPEEDPGREDEAENAEAPQVEFVKCYGCRLTFPKGETLGGFCATCADLNQKEETPEKSDSLDKGSPLGRAGRGNNGTGPDDRLTA